MMNTKEQIANLITETMEERGLNQTQMADALGLTKQTLNYWLHGKHLPTFRTVSRLRNGSNGWVKGFALRLSMILLSE